MEEELDNHLQLEIAGNLRTSLAQETMAKVYDMTPYSPILATMSPPAAARHNETAPLVAI